jgi:hypothetical protein
VASAPRKGSAKRESAKPGIAMARDTTNRPDPPGWRRIGPAFDQFPFWIDPVGAVSFTLVLFICFTPSHPCISKRR